MSSLLMFWLNSWNWGVSEAGGAEGAVVRDVESELREEEKNRTERRRKGEREIPRARRAGTEASRLGRGEGRREAAGKGSGQGGGGGRV